MTAKAWIYVLATIVIIAYGIRIGAFDDQALRGR